MQHLHVMGYGQQEVAESLGRNVEVGLLTLTPALSDQTALLHFGMGLSAVLTNQSNPAPESQGLNARTVQADSQVLHVIFLRLPGSVTSSPLSGKTRYHGPIWFSWWKQCVVTSCFVVMQKEVSSWQHQASEAMTSHSGTIRDR